MKWRKYIPHAILLGIAIAVSFYALRYWGDSKLHRNYPMTELTKKRVIGFTCCCRQSAALKHIGISFGFK
ncbi:hypothetical protein, partial [Pseudomonas aeruginosa]|uniref:hypothetical protein n=1 Tax=Pseudomonas aeruginosa TaxID=287 RepID=UPI001C1084E4